MVFRPSLDGYYKRQWPKNEEFEHVKARLRAGERSLAVRRDELEAELVSYARACRNDLHRRTATLLENPTWRRRILRAKCLHRTKFG